MSSNFIEQFHKQLYDSGVWLNSTWLGVPILKMPLDLHLYQEIIFEVQPDIIIETGTFNGGSALFFASMLDLIRKGKVISIDVSPQPNLPAHSRIHYMQGSSTDEETLEKVKSLLKPSDVILVSLDSDHTKLNVLQELETYQAFVTRGSYLIVEDTNINGHPVYSDFGPGPMEAVEQFLQTNDQFAIDHARHKFFVTFHPNGFLKKIK